MKLKVCRRISFGSGEVEVYQEGVVKLVVWGPEWMIVWKRILDYRGIGVSAVVYSSD